MSLPRYGAYKNSGVTWLGSVPAHWTVVQSRRYFTNRNEKAVVGDQQLTASQKHGVVYQTDFMELEGQKVMQVIVGADILKHAEPNDFVISMRSFQGGIEWCGLRGSISSAYVMLVPNDAIWSPFYRYLFKSAPYIQALQATTNLVRDGQALRFSNFAQVPLPLLPVEEQQKIAAFLDRETAKIDVLIAEQEKLIALLAEKRQATISRAVTKGLNPNAPMKDSGVAWVGEVPVHWEVRALRRVIAAIEQGWSPECHAREAEATEWGVLKAGCLNGGVFRSSENKVLPPELTPEEKYEVHAGDVLMSRASGSPELVGSTALVATTRPGLMLSDKIFRLHLQGAVMPRYFVAAMGSLALRTQIENALSGGNGMANNLPQSSLLAFLMTVPPHDEQRAIVDFIDVEIGNLNRLGGEAERAIALLRERRSALIAAAVTGQIDVRGA
ncbi:MAG: restriction endonuclease subunit S [Paucibacter sp.]|nr:restriction endonuclease subunit S [Roseateles sp.]